MTMPRSIQKSECNRTAPIPRASVLQTQAALRPMQKGTDRRLGNAATIAGSGATENSQFASAKSSTATPFPASIPKNRRPILLNDGHFTSGRSLAKEVSLLHQVSFRKLFVAVWLVNHRMLPKRSRALSRNRRLQGGIAPLRGSAQKVFAERVRIASSVSL